MTSLAARAWSSLVMLAAIIGVLLFGAAGTFHYWQAWVYLALLVVLSIALTLGLLHRDPALLERRMKGGPVAERRPVQQLIMFGVTLGFVALLVVPALDRRFGWSSVPAPLVLLGDLLFVAGFAFIDRVYRANSYTSATIEIAEGQRVIDTGPYAIVRHPMYASALVYLTGTSLALGSYWGLLAVLLILPSLVLRLVDEERMLAAELPGYREYTTRVRSRLIPGVW
jgi:protein-S-isoprenylcysteine O-methyltransferase Ste14